MASGKEIRGKIKSVENTKKITKAMEMISVSKMRKAQERMRAARPYTATRSATSRPTWGKANPEYVHAFMKTNDAKSVGFIVVTTDKGLCGGLNTNLFRAVTTKLRERRRPASSTRLWPSAARVWVFWGTALAPRWSRTSPSWATSRTWTS
jgi:F-type H+-transporting ATPase subunit gamma